MSTQDVAEKVVAWAGGTLGIAAGQRYSYPVAQKGKLPDVVAVVARKRRVRSLDPQDFPLLGHLQQNDLYLVYDIELSVQVEEASSEAGAKTAQEALESMVDSLEGSSRQDRTLGGRVNASSIAMNFDLSDPFQEYADGTKGRFLFAHFSVAEPVA